MLRTLFYYKQHIFSKISITNFSIVHLSILYIFDLIKYGRVGGRALFSDICILNKI